MEPRLKSSTQWSPFPEELCELTQKVLEERFFAEYDLEKAQFVVEGRIYPQEIIGRFGLRVEGQLKQYNFEVALEYDSEKEKALELIQQSMDVVDHLWTELLEEDLEDSDLPEQWQTMPHKKKMYFFRYSRVNTLLEEEADRLLKEHEKKLVYESDISDDIEGTPLENDEDSTLH